MELISPMNKLEIVRNLFMDNDFVDNMVGKPIADISPERLSRIQRWLIIVYKKIEYGLLTGIDQSGANVSLSHHQLQVITSSIWNAVFRVPVIEIIQEEDIAKQLLTQKIRPMTCDEIFQSTESSQMDN